MQISEMELYLCFSYFGYDTVDGFAIEDSRTSEQDMENINLEEIRRHFEEEKIMTVTENVYEFTPLAQYVFRTVGEADVYIGAGNESESCIRKIYIKDENYVCLEQRGDQIYVHFIPFLPLVIGAYAEMMDGQLAWAEGKGGEDTLSVKTEANTQGDIIYQILDGEQPHEEQEKTACINDITLWMIKHLREVEEA